MAAARRREVTLGGTQPRRSPARDFFAISPERELPESYYSAPASPDGCVWGSRVKRECLVCSINVMEGTFYGSGASMIVASTFYRRAVQILLAEGRSHTPRIGK